MAARTYTADQGLSPAPPYTGRDAAEGRGGRSAPLEAGADPALGVQPNGWETGKGVQLLRAFLKKGRPCQSRVRPQI